MKKPTFSKIILTIILVVLGINSYGQNLVPFTIDPADGYDQDIKGDIILIGNNILGPDNNAFNDTTVYNSDIDMQYIDIDGDPTTFSSSSADLVIPEQSAECYEIRYAALYWGAVERDPGQDFRNIKFKGPTGPYNDITGTVIYDRTTDTGTEIAQSLPYACFADVTNIVAAFSDANDVVEYTAANISSREGFNEGTGQSAGWSLFVVYEDPKLPGKSITSFNGFSVISRFEPPVPFDIVGFRTVPAPSPVRANFAFAALEGDSPIPGDRLRLNGTSMSAADRPIGNFFNSTVTRLDATQVLNRNPNSTNTLGFDTGVMEVPNPGNGVIANDATSATVSLETSGDTYFPYFFAMAVEIIEPNIILTKTVADDAGNDIGGGMLNLGDPLTYTITFENLGNDDATNFTIRDILPINIVFDINTDLILPPGVTVQSYNPVTREIVFSIDDTLVEEGDPISEIIILAQVVENCNELADACSNVVTNQAFATYQGTLNPNFVITDDPSVNSITQCLLNPQPTNFLANLDCTFEEDVFFCGESVELTAADGYNTYIWTTFPPDPLNPPQPTDPGVVGTMQTITVTAIGTYYVYNTAPAPCQSITQIFNVILFGANIPNPVIPFADEVVICPDDGAELPNIYLCGENDSIDIQTNIAGATSVIWEQLDESSCTAVSNINCANLDGTCTWNQVQTGPNYLADTAGQYRVTFVFPGNCTRTFYFNVYKNLLDPTVTATDIICDTPGTITVGNVPSGYLYSIDPDPLNQAAYQTSNIFSPINTPGLYTVHVIQAGLPIDSACIFTLPQVLIRERDFEATVTVTQPLCFGDQGTIEIDTSDGDPQYTYTIVLQDPGPPPTTPTIGNSGLVNDSDYTFSNLNPGIYTATVITDDGCMYEEDVEIIEPPLLTAGAAITQALACNTIDVIDPDTGQMIGAEQVLEGEITIFPVGGTPAAGGVYFYTVNGTGPFTDPLVQISSPGTYTIVITDFNNCTAETTINVESIPPPEFTVETTDILCADGDNGIITINVTNPNGNTLGYSITGGAPFLPTPIFPGLAAGDYTVVVQYSVGSSSCTIETDVTINANDPINGVAELTSPYTCTSNGTITVTGVTGGDGDYEYSLDGIDFQDSPVFPNLTDGTYTVTIIDGNDCTFVTNEIMILPLDPPTDLMFSSTPLTCPTNVSTVTLATTGGTGDLMYEILSPISVGPQSSEIFPDLAPNTYTFQVTDDNNCVYTETYTINSLDPLTVVGQPISNVTCVGDADGEAQFTVSGSTGFTYTINGALPPISGTSPINLTGLGAGTYTIEITDTATNCTASDTVNIEEPVAPLSITLDVTPTSCLANGSVVVNATGGWGGNTYTLTPPSGPDVTQSNTTFADLNQVGTFTVTVTDANGCIVTDTFDLVTPAPPTATIDVSSDYCYDTVDGASLVVNATGGTGTYQYSSNGGATTQDSNIFDNLIPGVYTITVIDSLGCTFTLPAETIANQLVVNAVLNDGLDCTPTPDAEITGTILGGYPGYTYEVSTDGGMTYTTVGTITSMPFTFTYTTASNGTYQFQVIDDMGCVAESGVININPLSLPDIISVTQTQPILCNGDSNAAINILIDTTVGTPDFDINVTLATPPFTDFGTQTSGLPAGTYTITLTDANDCTDTENITITQPDPLNSVPFTEPITCNGASGTTLGAVIIPNVTGGTGPYDYFVTGTNGYNESELNNPGIISTTFNVVDFGFYQVTIVDDNGCSILIQDLLVASPPDDLDIDVNTGADCLTGGTATVTVTTGTAVGPFYFTIVNGPIPPTMPLDPSWIFEDSPGQITFPNAAAPTPLIPGVTYTFAVFDQNTGCTFVETATPIPTNSSLTVSALDVNNVTCTGNADGSSNFTVNSTYIVDTDISYQILDALTLTPIGGPGTGTVLANSSLTINNFGVIPVGSYIVLITETSGPNVGCGVVTAPFNITESIFELEIVASLDQNANCNEDGTISAIASNGTPAYQYQVTTTPGAPLATDPNWGSASVFNRPAGSYFIHVLDDFGCIRTDNIDIPMDPEAVITATLTNQCTATEGNFEIEVDLTTAGIPGYAVSIDGGVFQTQTTFPFTITNLSSGIHTVAIQDSNGCGNTETITILPPLGINPTVTAEVTCLVGGAVTVETSGGSGTFTYAITPSVGILAGNVFSDVPAGTYTITVTDTVTGCIENAPVTLEAPIPVTFTTTATDVICFGDSNGTITVNLNPGNTDDSYTYEIIAGPVTAGSQNSNVFTGLPEGTYTVQVTSGKDCTATLDAIVGQPALVEASGVATDFACAPDNSVTTSTVTITGMGGTGTYTYSIDDDNYFVGNTFEIFDTGVVQTIDIYVQDENGCTATNTVTINPLPTLIDATVNIVNPIDCNNTGTVEIIVTGGSGDFMYELLPNAPQMSNVFPIPGPGTYSFLVTDTVTGCTIPAEIEVPPFDTIDVVATAISNISCFGTAEGEIEINVTGYTGNYTYEVLDSSGANIQGPTPANTSTNPQLITMLPAGVYTVVVVETDSPFCNETSNTVTITSPSSALDLDLSFTEVTCQDDGGTITAIASGGEGPYEYQLSSIADGIITAYPGTTTFTDLSSGTYTVTVRDELGCEHPEDITIPVTGDIFGELMATNLSCFGDQTAMITVINVGGGGINPEYLYTLNKISPTPIFSSGPQTSDVFENLGAGTYTVTISHPTLNCEFTTDEIPIAEPAQIGASLILVATQTCQSQAELTLFVSGGTPPYVYSDTEDFSSPLGTFNTSISFPVAPGTYTYYIQDDEDCVSSVSNQISIDEIPDLEIDVEVINSSIQCIGDTNGIIDVDAMGALGNYIYMLEDAMGNPIDSSTDIDDPSIFDNLGIGIYTVTVTSEDCPPVTMDVEITSPNPALEIEPVIGNVQCNGENDGFIEINATGGSGTYQYAISPNLDQFFNDNIFTNLPPGDYTVLVQDVLGCFETLDVTITEPDAVVLNIVPNSIFPEICEGDANGEFSIEISGGTPAYSVSLDDPDGVFETGTIDQTVFTFTNLSGGDHIVYVIDSLGCESEWNILFPDAVLINPIVIIEYGCENNSPSNTVTVLVDDSNTDLSQFDYSLNGGPYQPSNVFTNLAPGSNYFIDVRHTNGCIQTTEFFDILGFDPLELTVSEGGLNEIVATATGGAGGYQYEFSLNDEVLASGTENTFIISETGTYQVTVTDINGCIATANIFLEFIDICIPNYFTPNNDGITDFFTPGCADNYPNLKFLIFDRYGRKVANLNAGQKWDGLYAGKELPTGDYWYVVNLNDSSGREIVGHFTLYR